MSDRVCYILVRNKAFSIPTIPLFNPSTPPPSTACPLFGNRISTILVRLPILTLGRAPGDLTTDLPAAL